MTVTVTVRDRSSVQRFNGGVRAPVLALLFAASALQFGCVTRQRVPLDVGPGPVLLFVDGELATEIPEELELRADRDHKIFVKRDGYTPELVVLESRELDGRDRLEPPRIEIRLKRKRGDRDVRIEDDEGEEPAESVEREATR